MSLLQKTGSCINGSPPTQGALQLCVVTRVCKPGRPREMLYFLCKQPHQKQVVSRSLFRRWVFEARVGFLAGDIFNTRCVLGRALAFPTLSLWLNWLERKTLQMEVQTFSFET